MIRMFGTVAAGLLLTFSARCDVSSNAAPPAPFCLKAKYYGVQSRPCFRVGLGSHELSAELADWCKTNTFGRVPYFFSSILSADEVTKVRRVLAEEPLASKRLKAPPRYETPARYETQYVLEVLDGNELYYVPIGLDGGTTKVLRRVQSVLAPRSSEVLGKLIDQISILK